MRWSKILGLASLPALVNCYASTDSIQDVDPGQSGYLPNHNMDPKVVASSSFGVRWKTVYNTNEVFYAKPLVYTPTGFPNEQIITVSNQNIIRIIDGLTGALYKSRTLDPPFQSVDSNCGDIPNTVGITGTPIIDPATNTMYFFSKGYKGAVVGPAGTINGQYKFYAIDILTLADIPGFPVIIDGHHANNDPTRYFVGGTVLQRPSLASVGNFIVAGFGGHCDNFNYTGMLVSVSKTSNVGVTNIIAMEASPGAPSPQALDITVQGGGKAGIWQSGMGIATDGSQVFFVTGNGRGGGGVNGGGAPANGKVPISTLEQAVANFAVDGSSGILTQLDYFEPFEYNSLDGGDQDFGSSGVALLDPATFSGGGVARIAAAGGKSGKVYILDADNLGGFAGSSGPDNVIQTIANTNSLFSGVGSYPLDGGYIYYIPTTDVIHAYKLGFDGSGRPMFTLAGKSAATFAGKGVPTITSLNGQAGTGIVWVADINLGLVAYNAVPSGGVLQPIPFQGSGRLSKDERPAFGNGRVYFSNGNTMIAVGPSGTPVTSSSSSKSTTSSSSTKSSTSSSSRSSSSSSSSSSSTSTSTSHSTSSTKSSTTSTTSSTTTTGPSTNTATTTTSVTSTKTTTTATSSAYPYIGCFQDRLSGRALPLLFANNSVTPELCAAYVQSLAKQPTPTVLPYFYVEYHRECYGGTAFSFGTSGVTSLTGAHACTDVCSGSIGAQTTGTAFCGGPHQFNLYATNGVVNWPSPPTTSSV